MTEHDDHWLEMLPELVMGVLPESEAAGVRAHVAGCATCRAEADELRQVVALLPLAAEDLVPDPGLKDIVMERVGREPKPLRLARTLSIRAWLAPAAAVAAALLLLGLFLGRGLDDDSASEREAARHAQLVQAAAEGTLSIDRGEAGDVQVSFLRAPGATEGFAWFAGLPQPPAERAYQAWFTRDGKGFEPSAVFSGDAQGVWLPASTAIGEFIALGFTIEPEGGSSTPSQAPFLVVDLRTAARAP